MARVGRKPEKLVLAWSVLRGKIYAGPRDTQRVNSPVSLLGPRYMSEGYASSMLTKLEDAGYIKKIFAGTKIECIEMLKDVEELEEDVLGSSEDQPARVTRTHTPQIQMPAPIQAPAKAMARPQSQRPGVIILADYDNSAIPLKAAGSEFPAEGLLEFARGKGTVLTARVFIPMNVAREERLFLRRNGWRIMECPPLKDGGGDTVDKTIEEEMQLFVRMPSAATFIVVSRDADFQDAKRMVENHGRKCIFVYYDTASGEMHSEDGDVIRLSKEPQVTVNGRNGIYRNGRDANAFFHIVHGIENGMIMYDPANSMHEFIAAAIEALEAYSDKLKDPRTRMHFMALCELVWTVVRRIRRCLADFSRDDVRELLTALNNSGVLRKNNDDGQFTYYTFDEQCSFLGVLKKLQAL